MSFEGSRRLMFSIFEKQLLLKLIDKYKDVIEVKEFNKQAWLKKNEAFMKIQKEFNKTPGVVRRTAQQLRQCYFNLKKRISKKKLNSNSSDTSLISEQLNLDLFNSVLEAPSESNNSFADLVVPKQEPMDEDEVMPAPTSTVANIPSVVYISSAEQSNSQPPRPLSALSAPPRTPTPSPRTPTPPAAPSRTPTSPAAPPRTTTPPTAPPRTTTPPTAPSRTPDSPAAPPRTPTPVIASFSSLEPPQQPPPPRLVVPAPPPPQPQVSQRREAVRAAKAMLEQNMKIQYEKLKHEREEKEHMLRVKLYESQIKVQEKIFDLLSTDPSSVNLVVSGQ